ncbi:hypothetical protein [Streptomyces sp. NRRL B-24572]|uniref:hypothetical protein n=1 Tax=Streptomyces sp. NRRL B-24572 TaxID=1962156 RepID=UPI000A394808|nr:hypothetical protein [Streptomyces sp. NRRL B-24572]
MRRVAALAVAGALLALPACAPSVDPIGRLGRKAAERVGPRPAPVKAKTVRTVVDEKRCEEAGGVRPVTPRSDELALRLTEC